MLYYYYGDFILYWMTVVNTRIGLNITDGKAKISHFQYSHYEPIETLNCHGLERENEA